MIAFPPCKINLGLDILRRRDDGYHDIETCFYPVPWTDVLEIIRSDTFGFTVSGSPVSGLPSDNLCVRAYEIIRKDLAIGPVKMHLHKAIPMGAGLGGGSSDAAHVLLLLDRIFDLRLGSRRLREYAARLGSDCAFFISGQPACGTGRGDQLRDLQLSLIGKFLVVVAPDIHVSTADAYAGITPGLPAVSCAVVSELPITRWRAHLKNDFEQPAFRRHPVIGRIKQVLYDAGAVYASMSGSGGAVFGIFEKPVKLPPELRRYRSWCGAPLV